MVTLLLESRRLLTRMIAVFEEDWHDTINGPKLSNPQDFEDAKKHLKIIEAYITAYEMQIDP